MEVHPSARKHRVADEDIEHATTYATAIDDQDDDTRLYLGPSRSAAMLEVLTIVRDDGTDACDSRNEDAAELPATLERRLRNGEEESRKNSKRPSDH